MLGESTHPCQPAGTHSTPQALASTRSLSGKCLARRPIPGMARAPAVGEQLGQDISSTVHVTFRSYDPQRSSRRDSLIVTTKRIVLSTQEAKRFALALATATQEETPHLMNAAGHA